MGELGLLLGAYGGAQSGEQVGSWALTGACASLLTQGTDVHSSPQGLWVRAFSGATGQLRYDYGAAGDAGARASPDVSTHTVVVLLWARVDDGKLVATATWSPANVVVASWGALALYRLDAQASSNWRLDLALAAGSLGAAGVNLYLDDVTVAVDNFRVPLDPATLRQGALEAAQHVTLGGRAAEYPWHRRGAWTAVYRAAPSSLTDLANRWHAEGRPLLWAPNSQERYVAGLVSGQPAARPTPPYFGASDLTLLLQHYANDLVF